MHLSVFEEILLISLFPTVLVLSVLLIRTKKRNKRKLDALIEARVSIIIAVRNEKENLPALFNALEKLNYPHDKLEILIGDDSSTDGSTELIKTFCKKHLNISYHLIEESKEQKAKANVLMQLCEKAKGHFLLFLDADIIPSTELINNYLRMYSANDGGITGVTLPKNESLFSAFQNIDWCLALGMGYDAQGLGHKITAMGNNMFISRQVYNEVGGYRKLPTSIVEDFTLYSAIKDLGYDFPLCFQEELLVETGSAKSIKELLNQRKRWMTGGLKLSVFMKSILIIQGLYYPLIILLSFFNPIIAMPVCVIKLMLQNIYMKINYNHLGKKVSLIHLLLYEFYNTFFTCLLLLFYLLPVKIKWKERSYGNH